MPASITTVMYGVLSGEASITALVSADNIMAAPADLSVSAFPLITFKEENRETQILVTGQPSGLVESELNIMCAANKPESALAVAQAVDAFLNGYQNTAMGSLTCLLCYNTGSADGFDDDTETHLVNLSYSIAYK